MSLAGKGVGLLGNWLMIFRNIYEVLTEKYQIHWLLVTILGVSVTMLSVVLLLIALDWIFSRLFGRSPPAPAAASPAAPAKTPTSQEGSKQQPQKQGAKQRRPIVQPQQ